MVASAKNAMNKFRPVHLALCHTGLPILLAWMERTVVTAEDMALFQRPSWAWPCSLQSMPCDSAGAGIWRL